MSFFHRAHRSRPFLALALVLAAALVLSGCGLGGQSEEANKLIAEANGHIDKGNALDKEIAALFRQMGDDFDQVGVQNIAQAAATVKKIERADAQVQIKLSELNKEAKASALALAKARELNVSEELKTWLGMELEANGSLQKGTKVQAQLSKLFVKVARETHKMIAQAKSNAGRISSGGSNASSMISKAERDLERSTAAMEKEIEQLTETVALVEKASDSYDELKAKADAYFKEQGLGK